MSNLNTLLKIANAIKNLEFTPIEISLLISSEQAKKSGTFTVNATVDAHALAKCFLKAFPVMARSQWNGVEESYTFDFSNLASYDAEKTAKIKAMNKALKQGLLADAQKLFNEIKALENLESNEPEIKIIQKS